MMTSVLLYSVLACVLLHGIPIFARDHDVVKHPHHRHAEGHHQHHFRHSHKGLAARDSNSTGGSLAPGNATVNSTTDSNSTVSSTTDSNSTINSTLCLSSSQPELATIIKWLNNSNDLWLLYELVPPSVKVQFSSTSNVSVTNSTNTTILNGTLSIGLDSLYHEYSEYKVIEYFARVFGVLFVTPGFIATEFGSNIAKIILQAFIGGRNSTGNLGDNGSNNSWSNSNWSNLTHWENWLSPSKIISNVDHIEHAIEGGISNIVQNVTKLFDFKKHA